MPGARGAKKIPVASAPAPAPSSPSPNLQNFWPKPKPNKPKPEPEPKPMRRPAAATTKSAPTRRPASAAAELKQQLVARSGPAAAPARYSVQWMNDVDVAQRVMSTMEQKIRSCNATAVVLVFRSDCHWCQMMRPAWNSAVPQFLQTGSNVFEVDENVLSNIAGIRPRSGLLDAISNGYAGVPHVVAINSALDSSPYSHDRSTSSLVSWSSAVGAALRRLKENRSDN